MAGALRDISIRASVRGDKKMKVHNNFGVTISPLLIPLPALVCRNLDNLSHPGFHRAGATREEKPMWN